MGPIHCHGHLRCRLWAGLDPNNSPQGEHSARILQKQPTDIRHTPADRDRGPWHLGQGRARKHQWDTSCAWPLGASWVSGALASAGRGPLSQSPRVLGCQVSRVPGVRPGWTAAPPGPQHGPSGGPPPPSPRAWSLKDRESILKASRARAYLGVTAPLRVYLLSLRLTVRDLVTHWPNDSSCCGSQSRTTRPSLTRCGHTNDGDRPPGGPGDTAQLEAPPGGSKGPLVQEGLAGLEGASHGCPHAAPSTWRATCQGLEPETQARSRAAGTVGA